MSMAYMDAEREQKINWAQLKQIELSVKVNSLVVEYEYIERLIVKNYLNRPDECFSASS